MSQTKTETVVVGHGHHSFPIELPFEAEVFEVEIKPDDVNTVSVEHEVHSKVATVTMDIRNASAQFTYFAAEKQLEVNDKSEAEPNPLQLPEAVVDSVKNDANDVKSGNDVVLNQQGLPNPAPGSVFKDGK